MNQVNGSYSNLKFTITYETFHEKTNILESAYSIDPDQPRHVAQANQVRHVSHPLDFLFQES